MTQQGNETSTGNNVWLRGVFIILFGILYSLAGTVLLVVAVLQFIFSIDWQRAQFQVAQLRPQPGKLRSTGC